MRVDVRLLCIAAHLAGGTERVALEFDRPSVGLGELLERLGDMFGEEFARMSADHGEKIVKLTALRKDETLLYDCKLFDGDEIVLTLACLGG
jgi:hypothetical protein